jgi:hypothetical protein
LDFVFATNRRVSSSGSTTSNPPSASSICTPAEHRKEGGKESVNKYARDN